MFCFGDIISFSTLTGELDMMPVVAEFVRQFGLPTFVRSIYMHIGYRPSAATLMNVEWIIRANYRSLQRFSSSDGVRMHNALSRNTHIVESTGIGNRGGETVRNKMLKDCVEKEYLRVLIEIGLAFCGLLPPYVILDLVRFSVALRMVEIEKNIVGKVYLGFWRHVDRLKEENKDRMHLLVLDTIVVRLARRNYR